MRLKVTNTKTGASWIEENRNHSWEQLCLDMMKNHSDINLIWCDIEGIAKIGDTYYLLDECGKWDYIPDEYAIEPVDAPKMRSL